MSRQHRLALGMLVAATLATMLTNSAAAHDRSPLSQAEAIALGDPAGSAPTAAADEDWLLDGEKITPNEAAYRNLACIEDDSPITRCYRNEDILRAEEDLLTRAQARASSRPAGRQSQTSKRKASRAHRARIAQHAFNPMQVSADPLFGGWDLFLNSQCAWYDLTGGFNNAVSSEFMGNHSGHLSENAGGGGFWFPGDTSAYVAYSNIGTSVPGWDNRISSRYRQGCP